MSGVTFFTTMFHTFLGRFSQGYSGFLIHLKIGILTFSGPLFLVSRRVCTKPAWLPRVVTTYVCAAAITQRRLEKPVG